MFKKREYKDRYALSMPEESSVDGFIRRGPPMMSVIEEENTEDARSSNAACGILSRNRTIALSAIFKINGQVCTSIVIKRSPFLADERFFDGGDGFALAGSLVV